MKNKIHSISDSTCRVYKFVTSYDVIIDPCEFNDKKIRRGYDIVTQKQTKEPKGGVLEDMGTRYCQARRERDRTLGDSFSFR